MCKWGDTVDLLVPIMAEHSYTGQFRWDVKAIDRCIADIIQALNDKGIYTGGSCCGHGKRDGWIALHDGRWLTITNQKPGISTTCNAEDNDPDKIISLQVEGKRKEIEDLIELLNDTEITSMDVFREWMLSTKQKQNKDSLGDRYMVRKDTIIEAEVIRELENRGSPLYYNDFDCYRDYQHWDFMDTLNALVDEGVLFCEDGVQYGLVQDSTKF